MPVQVFFKAISKFGGGGKTGVEEATMEQNRRIEAATCIVVGFRVGFSGFFTEIPKPLDFG